MSGRQILPVDGRFDFSKNKNMTKYILLLVGLSSSAYAVGPCLPEDASACANLVGTGCYVTGTSNTPCCTNTANDPGCTSLQANQVQVLGLNHTLIVPRKVKPALTR